MGPLDEFAVSSLYHWIMVSLVEPDELPITNDERPPFFPFHPLTTHLTLLGLTFPRYFDKEIT